jgi:hypothetical protein
VYTEAAANVVAAEPWPSDHTKHPRQAKDAETDQSQIRYLLLMSCSGTELVKTYQPTTQRNKSSLRNIGGTWPFIRFRT